MKESDIYTAPLVLFQLVEHVENIVHVSKEKSSRQSGIHEIEYSSLVSPKQIPFPSDKPDIPDVIKENKPLLRIVRKCLSPRPAQRPTAAALCKMLRDLCRSSIVRRAGLDILKSALSMFKRVMP
ncbi:hypothetical protein BYT27DRAFT_7202234 [Phlegmacium glaucopus]|nr:hypothetical protein BYT27DRAFT_7202234 [Phlegmacium glaucopus]